MSPWPTVLLAGCRSGFAHRVRARDLGAHGGIGRRIAGHRQRNLPTSNQLVATIGASVGGLVLTFGGFSSVGLLCLGAAIMAALVIGAKLRGIGAIAAQAADA